jgi:hypothetical protein
LSRFRLRVAVFRRLKVFSQLFEIRAIKHYEVPASDHLHKSLVVVQGSCVLDAEGRAAFISDHSVAPTSLPAIRATIRATIAPRESTGCRATQSDATQAYCQAWLGSDECICVIIPQDLWLPAIHEAVAAAGLSDLTENSMCGGSRVLCMD